MHHLAAKKAMWGHVRLRALISKPETCNNPKAFKTSLGKSLMVEDKQLKLLKKHSSHSNFPRQDIHTL